MEEVLIQAYNVVGNAYCVEAAEGEKVYALINKAFKEGKKAKVSFQNVEMLTSAFLNTAFGQAYRDFSEADVKKRLSVSEMAPEDMALLKRVTETAKLYYKDPDRLERSINEVLGEE